jgi:uncharacterized protein YbjT (DUF2867 family)
MKVVLFGATGMVGQGVLRECLLDKDVTHVLSVGRRPINQKHEKLHEIIVPDVGDLSAITGELAGFDACFFPLGVSSAGMSEERYSVLTYDLTIAVATTLAGLNPALTFVYVSGVRTDSTERGGAMWARVKGRTENALLAMFKSAYMFRPGVIQPMHGIKSRTPIYRVMYAVMGPLVPLLRKLFPGYVTTTEQVGKAMINVARRGYPKRILEPRDIEIAAGGLP